MRSVPRCYKQDQWAQLLVFSDCEFQLEAVSWGRGQLKNVEEGECPLFKAATK
jgi:hypothetical protein